MAVTCHFFSAAVSRTTCSVVRPEDERNLWLELYSFSLTDWFIQGVLCHKTQRKSFRDILLTNGNKNIYLGKVIIEHWKTVMAEAVKNMGIRQTWANTVLLLQIGCIHCLLIQTLWRFYRSTIPYVKSSSRWVTGVLAWTWPTCGRKVGLMIHLTASTTSVSYCCFMTALLWIFLA